MTSIRGWAGKISMLAATVAILGGIISASASDKVVQGSVKVLRVQGSVRYSTDQTTWKELKKGAVLKAPVLIQTAPRALADILLHDGQRVESLHDEVKENSESILRLLENSALSIDKLTHQKTHEGTVEEVQLDLRAGDIMGSVERLLEAWKYEIKFPKGVIGVRGGTYMTSSDGVLNVLTGSAIIVIMSPDGSMNTKKVSPRQGFDPTSGKVTQLSLEMLPDPLTSDQTVKPSGPPAATSGIPHGTGMGGSLRKF